MDKTPSSEIQERLRALCRQITVAEEIDPEIQEELMSHVEDRFNGYLHGKDPITEEDAFLLVREHFGNPAVVKELLQHAHVQEATVSLGRRPAAIAMLGLGCYGAGRILNAFTLSVLLALSSGAPALQPYVGMVWTLYNVTLITLLVAFTWFVVLHWERQVARGERPWFIRWTPVRIWQCLAGALLLFCMVPSIGISTGNFGTSGPTAGVFVALAFLAIIVQSVAWLWWCDRPPRIKRNLSYATLAWILLGIYGAMPFLVLSVSNEGSPGSLHLGQFADATWSLTLAPFYMGMANTLATAFGASAAIGYGGRAVYWFAQRLTGRPSDSLRHDRPDYFPHYD
ncbi:MAG: hypothetical protein AMXMBFR82_05840 [Candidatus Hydrogenedentota bacterium]